jgi:transcription elongation factor Elf1
MSKEKQLGYTSDDLESIQDVAPTFPCPHCNAKNWVPATTFYSSPTRLWRATTLCSSCQKHSRWLIDPDLTVALQTKQMHRPLGF